MLCCRRSQGSGLCGPGMQGTRSDPHRLGHFHASLEESWPGEENEAACPGLQQRPNPFAEAPGGCSGALLEAGRQAKQHISGSRLTNQCTHGISWDGPKVWWFKNKHPIWSKQLKPAMTRYVIFTMFQQCSVTQITCYLKFCKHRTIAGWLSGNRCL